MKNSAKVKPLFKKMLGYDKTEVKQLALDLAFSAVVMLISFIINQIILTFTDSDTLIPTVFVLGIFLISVKTQGYIISIFCSVLCVFAVNFAFTYPYNAFDLLKPEYVFAAFTMLVISVITGALTTKLKETEKQKSDIEKEKLRANLLRAVSHDLRTPLTSIYGAASAVAENYDNLSREDKISLMEKTREDAQWLCRMVENLLSVTRIDGGEAKIIKSSTVLEELVDSVIKTFRKRYPNVEVKVTIPDDFFIIPMDAMLIEQVIINLLENAVVHAKGMKSLWLKVYVKGQYAVFEVSDDGCGIDEDKLPHIFSGISSSASSDSGRHNMGIGLSVCAAIIKAHGGKIEAENNEYNGATFRFELELEDDGAIQYGG